MNQKRWAVVLGATLAMAGSAVPRVASACGGLFCSQAAPVNQAAERIIFADNGDGTVTAVIEIQYQGPSQNFSWLLPISTAPQGNEIAVASKVAFDRLQATTNPQYQLNVKVEGECAPPPPASGFDFGAGGAAAAEGGASSAGGASSGVTVEGSGVVGDFEWV